MPPIFAGQMFFFVPIDRLAVPRRRRIDKAVLYGATWARIWTSSVTHVIVESDRKMADVVKATGQKNLPSNIFLVADTWLTESLSYKEMRDSTAQRFQVMSASTTSVQVYIQEADAIRLNGMNSAGRCALTEAGLHGTVCRLCSRNLFRR
jgi:hypothetical protein